MTAPDPLQALRRALLAAWPQATHVEADVERDDNTPGAWYPAAWRLYRGEAVIASSDGDEQGLGPAAQALADYVDATGTRADLRVALAGEA